MACTVTTRNKTGTKSIKYRIDKAEDARLFMNILSRYGYGFVLSADEEEGDDHGYKDNDRR